ncbi:hypothetical protein GCM10020000_78840 [Streptomyces olivoverticillatus]
MKTALTLPFVILGLPVGAWLDRVRRRPVMIGADLVRAAALTTVPVAAWFGRLTMTHLLAVVVVQGVATVFFDLGTQSFVKDLAPGALLARTNARLATITQAAVIAGPPLAGWAAGLLSAPTVLLVMAAGYLWSAGWLSTLTTREHPASGASRPRLLHQIGEGVTFVARQSVLRTVVIAGSMVNIGIAGVMTLLPVLALTELGWSEGTLGMFLGAERRRWPDRRRDSRQAGGQARCRSSRPARRDRGRAPGHHHPSARPTRARPPLRPSGGRWSCSKSASTPS